MDLLYETKMSEAIIFGYEEAILQFRKGPSAAHRLARLGPLRGDLPYHRRQGRSPPLQHARARHDL